MAMIRLVEEAIHGASKACHYLSVSLQSLYFGLRRDEEFGEVGPRERSSPSRTCIARPPSPR